MWESVEVLVSQISELGSVFRSLRVISLGVATSVRPELVRYKGSENRWELHSTLTREPLQGLRSAFNRLKSVTDTLILDSTWFWITETEVRLYPKLSTRSESSFLRDSPLQNGFTLSPLQHGLSLSFFGLSLPALQNGLPLSPLQKGLSLSTLYNGLSISPLQNDLSISPFENGLSWSVLTDWPLQGLCLTRLLCSDVPWEKVWSFWFITGVDWPSKLAVHWPLEAIWPLTGLWGGCPPSSRRLDSELSSVSCSEADEPFSDLSELEFLNETSFKWWIMMICPF